jgi:hypothetical protein
MVSSNSNNTKYQEYVNQVPNSSAHRQTQDEREIERERVDLNVTKLKKMKKIPRKKEDKNHAFIGLFEVQLFCCCFAARIFFEIQPNARTRMS